MWEKRKQTYSKSDLDIITDELLADDSDDTISTDNRSPPRVQTRFLMRDNISFAARRLNVNASKEAVKEMQAGLVDLSEIFQEADNMVILTPYKT